MCRFVLLGCLILLLQAQFPTLQAAQLISSFQFQLSNNHQIRLFDASRSLYRNTPTQNDLTVIFATLSLGWAISGTTYWKLRKKKGRFSCAASFYFLVALAVHLVIPPYKIDVQSYLMENEQSVPLIQSARQSFVRKVYSVITVQLLFTVIIVYFSIHSKSFSRFIGRNVWPFWTSFVMGIVTLLALSFGNLSTKVPINYILLTVFTACQSILVSYVCYAYEPSSVLLAAVGTFAATLGLTYYAMTSKEDFTKGAYVRKGALYSLIWIVSSVSVLNLFLRNGTLSYGISIAFAFIYSFYLLIDTQMILGKKEKRVGLDDYILGAAIIYMDIISLFLKLIEILGKKKKNE